MSYAFMAFVFDPDRLNGTGDPGSLDVSAILRGGRGVVEQCLVPLDTEVLWRCVAALSVGLAEVEIDADAKTGLRGRGGHGLATKLKWTSSAWRQEPPSSPHNPKAKAPPSRAFETSACRQPERSERQHVAVSGLTASGV
jgi:hypothetical protein